MDLDSPRQSPPNKLRLQKFMAQCGIGSRRACENYIRQGLVTVDGTVVSEQGAVIDPGVNRVCFRGEPVSVQSTTYLVLNKPRDVLCTSSDPRGRRTFLAMLPPMSSRVYTVGRLDRDSEGLLIVTNDGQLAACLTHPRHHISKVYKVWTDAPLAPADVKKFLQGIMHAGQKLTASEVRLAPEDGVCAEITLLEGKNRQIRRMFAAVGRKVDRLCRVRIGPLQLKGLRSGQWRHLTAAEVTELKQVAGKEPGTHA